ncbi:MAG TPA: LacI family DNA-binding transcriptional regulator [Dictyoglomaceae bacterium]|nr:LacI family DNA-binding transcriptional regulator [Dictyoglomaceae bacterium]HOP95278.1 LacI family DNA-binding transcriptional regulator [Dictyoglomaceae bacterium]HPU43265.1 LacI family DNA-binding transcriptional regulator [Dictyoglomaceae bacterium]
MTKKRRITIKDIAKEAEVSPTTVSNVIRKNYQHVSPETVEKIEKIIQEKGYVPNMLARSLVKKHSKIIGIINCLIPTERGSFVQDPFHTVFIGGVERELSGRGYFSMLRTISSADELLVLLKNWNLAGIIITGVFEDEFFQVLKTSEIPVVLVDSYVKGNSFLKVGLEDFKGGYLATKYLIERGHREILFVSPKIKPKGVLEERLKGYKTALEEAGIPFKEKNVYEHGTKIGECILLGKNLSKREDFTAIFVTADIIAAGVMSGLAEMGVRIPDDVSIVGFDDLDISLLTRPKLTTIHQDVEKKGIIAAQMLVDYIEEKYIKEKEVILPVYIVERESVKNLKEF